MAEEKELKETDIMEQVSMDCGECMYILGKLSNGGKGEDQAKMDLRVHIRFARHVVIKPAK